MNHQTPPLSVLTQVRDTLPLRPLAPNEVRSVLERAALQLLTLMDVPGPPVVVGELIAGLPRAIVIRVEGLTTSGRTHWDGARWIIEIAADEPHVRQRYTLAHELGHILLHPIADIILPSNDNTTSEKRLEVACEFFAACLLMPRVWMKRAYFGSDIRDVPSLARLFEVSWGAMRTRLEQLGLIARIDTVRAA